MPFVMYETPINRLPITDATMKLMSETEPFNKKKNSVNCEALGKAHTETKNKLPECEEEKSRFSSDSEYEIQIFVYLQQETENISFK